MTVLITGANGYLGNVLVKKLADSGIRDLLLVDLGIFSSNAFNYSKLDLRNCKFQELFPPTVDAIIHLAGVSNDPSCELDYRLTQEMNIDASKRLIDFASIAKVKKVIFASSASVYGANPLPVTEEAKLNPQSEYARSKIAIESYLLEHKELNPIIFRFGTLFGFSPKMRFDLAVNLMVKDAILTGTVNVSGGEQSRPFLHVEDAANIIIASASQISTGIYNFCTSNSQIIYLAEAIADLTNAKLNIKSGTLDPRDYKLDCSKIKKEFSYRPANSIVYGIQEISQFISSYKDKLDFDNTDYYTISAWKRFLK